MSADLDIQAIRERANAATPGPWACDGADSAFDEDGRCINDEQNISSCIQDACGNFIAECIDIGADRVFIANARKDVPALCDEVERLREEARRYYLADGSYVVLGSAEEVIARRKEAAAALEWLKKLEQAIDSN